MASEMDTSFFSDSDMESMNLLDSRISRRYPKHILAITILISVILGIMAIIIFAWTTWTLFSDIGQYWTPDNIPILWTPQMNLTTPYVPT